MKNKQISKLELAQQRHEQKRLHYDVLSESALLIKHIPDIGDAEGLRAEVAQLKKALKSAHSNTTNVIALSGVLENEITNLNQANQRLQRKVQ